MAKIVIIGNSAAGFSCLETLIREAAENEVTVITKEKYPAYRKDLLFDYLAGNIQEKDIFLCKEDFYKKKKVNYYKNSEIDRLDTKKQFVQLKDKSRINYDYLVIASGEETPIPDIPGKNKDGVFGVYSLTDIERIKDKLLIADVVCIVGKLRFSTRLAEIIACKGKEVKIITEESNDSGIVVEKTEIIAGFSPGELIGEGPLQALKLNNGKVIAVSLVLFCGNYIASTGFLKGTEVENNEGYVLTGREMATNLENIFACGTVAKERELPEKDKLWKDCVDEGSLAAESLIKLMEKGEMSCQKS